MGQKLIAVGEYHCPPRGLHFRRGQELEVDNALYLFLMADAPGCFESVPEKVTEKATEKALGAPPADKMLRSPKVKK